MPLSPRVLLSIDYEPVFALFRHYDKLSDHEQRRNLDAGFTLEAIDPILAQLGDAKASIYLVGEIAGWYPEVPQKIVDAGHELGLHCHIHRPLINVKELAEDLRASAVWCPPCSGCWRWWGSVLSGSCTLCHQVRACCMPC